MIPRPLARRLITAAQRFESLAPWQEFSDEEPVAFELPDAAHPVYAITLGKAGQAFGLALYCGERALEQLRLVESDAKAPVVTTMLVLNFEPPAAAPEPSRAVALAAGISDRIIPAFWAVDPSRRGRTPTNRELRLFTQVLEAFATADAADLLRPRRLEPHRASKVLTLRVAGDARKVADLTARFVEVPAAESAAPALASLPWPLPELPLADEHWVIGLEPSPIDVTGTEVAPEVLVSIDAATEDLLGMQVVVQEPPHDPLDLEPAAQAFAYVCKAPVLGEPRLPRQLTFTHQRLAEALAPGLTHLGVVVECVAEHAAVRQLLDELAAKSAVGAADPTHIPGPADGPLWDAVQRRLEDLLHAEFECTDVYSRRALAEYFGDVSTFEAIERTGTTVAQVGYEQWYHVHYRAKHGRRTIAERLLAGDLPPDLRTLLQAHVDARAGIYRVTELRPPLFVLRDVLSDHSAEIVDGGLAAQMQEEMLLPVRIGDAAGHLFVLPSGPMLRHVDLESAIAWIEEQFGSCTSQDLQRQPQRLGALWTWKLQRRSAAGPQLENTDGDPLRLIVATFRVADWGVLLRELAVRDDVEAHDEAEKWTWLRLDRGPVGVGGNTVIAGMERVADELLVHVNSEERLRAVREWLEVVPGVTFDRQREVAAGEEVGGARRRRLESMELGEVAEDGLAEVQGFIDAQCMSWIDQEVPALGGRTPREAVKDAAGREAVLRLIRSWPDPGGVKGLRVPRERMLGELGIGGG